MKLQREGGQTPDQRITGETFPIGQKRDKTIRAEMLRQFTPRESHVH